LLDAASAIAPVCEGTVSARAGELARVAVLRGHLPEGTGAGAKLLGTVFAHRVFDIFPIALLVVTMLRARSQKARTEVGT
jgi:hypothetical protein